MDLFFNNEDRLKINGCIFFRGQRVIYNYGHKKFSGVIDPSKPLLCYYFEHYEQLPVLVYTDDYSELNAVPCRYLEIVDVYKEKKGGLIRMPRIFKWIFYLILLTAFWRVLNPTLDLLLQLLQSLILKK
jgi:hypothetical protein